MKATLCALGMGAALAVPSSARVVWTGYGDFKFTLQGRTTVGGPPALLNSLGVSDTILHSRSGSIGGLGFFAVTEIDEGLTFENDITYRDIGFDADRIQVQYAFLNWNFAPDWKAHAGKITLPFGYLNQERFYPFRRPSISAPLFHSFILGLPIADIGASVAHERAAGPLRLRAELYGVNGYGHIAGSTAAFRSGSLAGGLAISSNLKAGNSNDELAHGARLTVLPLDSKRMEAGVSLYQGDWDAKGERLFRMWGAHAHAYLEGFDLLVEGLLMRVEGDEGFLKNLGDRNWRTIGGFVTLSYDKLKVGGRMLEPWVRGEWYRSEARANRFGAEIGHSYAGGFSWLLRPTVQLKLEFLHFDYIVPFVPAGGLTLDADLLSSAVTVTF